MTLGVAKCGFDVRDLRDEPLLAFELLRELSACLLVHPGGVLRFIANDGQPYEAPEYGRKAFENEGHLPADCADEIAGCGRHPEDGDWIAEEKEGVGARALRTGEPAGKQDQHSREDETFGRAEQKSVERQQPEVADDSGERGEDTPRDQREEDKTTRASAPGVGCAGNLEEKVSEEEESAKQRRLRVADVQRLRESGGGPEAVVGAVHVRETVSNEDSGQDGEPAPAHLGLCPVGLTEEVAGWIFGGCLHCGCSKRG